MRFVLLLVVRSTSKRPATRQRRVDAATRRCGYASYGDSIRGRIERDRTYGVPRPFRTTCVRAPRAVLSHDSRMISPSLDELKVGHARCGVAPAGNAHLRGVREEGAFGHLIVQGLARARGAVGVSKARLSHVHGPLRRLACALHARFSGAALRLAHVALAWHLRLQYLYFFFRG